MFQFWFESLSALCSHYFHSIRFIYYDDTAVAIQSFVSTFVAAEKYSVGPLSKALINQIKRLDGDETCILLKHLENQRLNNKELQSELAKKQQMETKRIIDSDEFPSLSLDTVVQLISRESLNVNESELFQAVLRWAKNQCLVQRLEINPPNLKKAIARLTYLFSYTSMSLKEFANGPAKMRILNDKELTDLFLHFTLEEESDSALPKQLTAAKRRPFPVYQVSVLGSNSSRDGERPNRSSSLTEYIDFKTDGEIYLRGIQNSFQLAQKERKLVLWIERSDEELEQIACKTIGSFDSSSSDGKKSKNRTEFDYPLLIEPNITYRLQLHWESAKYGCESKWMASKASSGDVKFLLAGSPQLSHVEKLIFHKF